jgi:DNA-binding PadR family transcriptional regulator
MTNAELAILSLIAEKPRHGYDIEQVIEARGMREWTEMGFSSIYYLLNKLEKTNLIESKLQAPSGRGPARKVYSITDEGRETHLTGTLDALSNPQSGFAPFLLGLSSFPAIPRDQIIVALRTYATQLEDRLDHLLGRLADQQPLPPYINAMFDYSQVLIEAELNWIRKFIHEVEAGNV